MAGTGPVSVEVPHGYQVGEWEVTGLIAGGGWATVYSARRVGEARSPDEPAPGTPAALKFLASATLTPQQSVLLREMVRHEIAFSRQAGHPRLVRTFECLVVDDPSTPAIHGATVLVMEQAGGTLRDLITVAAAGWGPGTSGAAPVPDADRLLGEVAEGLAHLHASGFVHGDLKPSNILVMADGSVRLADFGLTRELEGTHAYAPPGHGSLDYVPPEWWTEQVGERGVASRTTGDVWAFGVTAHQTLTGGLFPFPGATAQARAAAAKAYAAGREPLRLASSLPPAWEPVLRACLAPDRRERSIVAPGGLPSGPATPAASPERDAGAGPSPRLRRPQRLGRRPAVLAGAVLLLAGGVAVAATRGGSSGGGLPATSDQAPCDADQVTRLDRRVQYCPLFGTDTPVFDSPDRGNEARVVGTMRGGGRANWFVGQAERSSFRLGSAQNRWWAYTLSDDRTWGWVPEVYFTGGADNERDAGLHLCGVRGNPCTDEPPGEDPEAPMSRQAKTQRHR